MIPYIMSRRSDAQIFAKQVVCTDSIDEYILEKRHQGYRVSYMHLFIAAYVRVIAERPQLNRFVMNRQLYSREGIFVSMAVKRSLHDEGDETTVKFGFTGLENIFEVADIVDRSISENIDEESRGEAERTAARIMSMPGLAKKVLVELLKSMDKHNMLPRRLIEVSPFHTTLFFSYLKSIKTEYVYHHLYDFGTTGIFAAMGKKEKLPVVENGEVVVSNCCQIGYTFDERICDGLYLANSLKLLKQYIENPQRLETRLDAIAEDLE
ncbi:MAG: hypothetical protein H6Q58_193 [Firmicutes bacterium]|nr:hypothetical protein [Bacillota bacterium]